MQFSVTVSGTKAELAAQFAQLAGAFGATHVAGNTVAVDERDDGDEQPEAPKKRGRPAKAAAPAPEENDEGDEDDAFGGDDDDDKEPTLSRDDVSKGFRAYAGEHGAPAAKKILDRFGVKSVKELAEDQFELAMKALAKGKK